MRDYGPRLFGIVHVPTEKVLLADGKPLLFRSLTSAEKFVKEAKLDGNHLPITLSLYGESPLEILGDDPEEKYIRQLGRFV